MLAVPCRLALALRMLLNARPLDRCPCGRVKIVVREKAGRTCERAGARFCHSLICFARFWALRLANRLRSNEKRVLFNQKTTKRGCFSTRKQEFNSPRGYHRNQKLRFWRGQRVQYLSNMDGETGTGSPGQPEVALASGLAIQREKGDEADFVGGRGGHARVSGVRARWYCRSRGGDCLMHHFC